MNDDSTQFALIDRLATGELDGAVRRDLFAWLDHEPSRWRRCALALLEARDRVGGRVWNHDLGGGQVSERGGTFVGPTQDYLLALAGELGVGTFPTYDTGDDVYVADGQRMTYSDSGPLGTAPPDPLTLAEITADVELLDQMSTGVPVDSPWTASNAADYDSQTLQSWIDTHSITPRFKERRFVTADL